MYDGFRGDANADGTLDVSDAIVTLGFLYLGEPSKLDCKKSADTDDSGILEVTDAIYLLTYKFLGGPEPSPPFPSCGVDTVTPDLLPCESFAGCR